MRGKKSIILENLLAPFKKRLLLLKYFIDFILIIFSYWLTYYIRFEGAIPSGEFAIFQQTLLIFAFGFLVCDFLFGLARGMWRYVSLRDIERIFAFVLAGNGLSIITGILFFSQTMMKIPRSIYIINSLLLFLSISGVRLSYRILFDRLRRLRKGKENVLIIGDGDIAVSLQYTILKDHSHQFKIIGFITFDKNRLGNTINTIPIIGLLEDVPNLVKKNDIKYIFIAVDSASNEEMKKIIKVSQKTDASIRIVPTILDMVSGKFSLRDLREIKFEDYLERKPVEFNTEKIKSHFYKKTILVTGGGGSIGSNICKELIKFSPAKLIVLDISENNLFTISQDLKDFCNKACMRETELIFKIADVRNRLSLERIFKANSIDYLIHAAACKHISLSEENPLEAISTNVCGTLNLIICANRFNVKKFVYISTDKAVEPISVMGATKRVGELLIKSFNADKCINTKFMAVRFGNVIGSSGNVVEIFTQQLQKNEPLSITDPRMERYFMSLDEATKLILEAISLGKGGEIFLLDMGKPVKIKDLAYDMALFYGKELKEDNIIYTGKRKGEKLSEKLLGDNERKVPTLFNKIFEVQENITIEGFKEKVEELCKLSYQIDEEKIRDHFFSLISPHK